MSPLLSLNFITLNCFLLLAFTPSILGEEVEFTTPLASSLCGQWEEYKKTKEIQPSLATIPVGSPFLSSCEDNWVWNRCDTKGQKDCGKFYHVNATCLKKSQRVLGGKVAGPTEFPWDVSIRFIYDWGTFWKQARDEVNNNDFKGLKEAHRCTGTFYTASYIITSGWCGSRAKEFVHTKNRYVAWLARGKYIDSRFIEKVANSTKNESQGDIFIHPLFNAEVGLTTNHDRDHDIAIIQVGQPFQFKKTSIYAIQLAPKEKTFAGEKAIFTGWGTTNRSYVGSMLENATNKVAFGNKLYKLEMQILPYEGTCKDLLIEYLEVNDEFDINEDLSVRYICAKGIPNKKGDIVGACGGDVGGPLICKDGANNYLCGIRVSWSIVKKCPAKDNIDIFVRASYYLQWIEKVAGKQKPKDLKP